MSVLLGALTTLRSCHLLSWGALLGTQVYQTFVMTKLAYVHLARPQFMALQKHVFPAYFGAETALAVATAVTLPVAAAAGTDLVLLAVTLGTSALNLVVYGPRTIQALTRRSGQETAEGVRLGASSELPRDKLSAALYRAKRQFSVSHAMSIHLNLVGLLATVAYGLSLGARVTIV